MNERELISKIDGIRMEQNMTQAEWCRRAGFDELGVAVSRTFNRGNCKLSVFVRLAKALGYRVELSKEDSEK